MILGFVLAGTQVALPQYNKVIKERPLLGQDYPSHYTHYSVPEKILNFNVEFWVDLRRDEKIDLIRTISKINDSIAVSKAYKELFNVEKDVSIKKEILSNLVHSKPVTRTQTWLKSLISSKEFKKEAFKAFAVHASSNEIQSYIQNDLELLIIAAGLGKVNDAQILLKNYDSLKAIHDQAVFVTQLAFLKHDEAFRLCKSYYLQLKFVSSSTSTEFLIKQSKIKALAQASLIRMKELGWNLQFNNRAKEIINSDQSELKTSACEILIMHESNAAFLARNLNKMDTPTGLTALKFFEEKPVIKSYENDFCKMKLGSDAINIAKINIFEDQYIIAAKDEVSRVLEKSRNPELIRAALRYLGLMKFKVNNLQRFVKDRNIRVQEGLVFYLACSTNFPSVKEFDKYIKSPDMKIRRAFYDGVAHNPNFDFSNLVVSSLKNRKDNRKDMQPSSEVRSYLIWALMQSNQKPVDQCFFEMKKLITTKLVKVPMSENIYDPFYLRGIALLCLARWANSGAKEAQRFYKESLEFIEWQKQENLEYSSSFDQILDLAKAIHAGRKNNKLYTYSKSLAVKLINRPLK